MRGRFAFFQASGTQNDVAACLSQSSCHYPAQPVSAAGNYGNHACQIKQTKIVYEIPSVFPSIRISLWSK